MTYVQTIKDMCDGITTSLITLEGKTNDFLIRVGLH